MVYTEYFGLREAPFNATPDPRFFYRNNAYDEAYATLVHGIRARQGFIVLTGEVGTGKTTLLRRLMDELAGTTRFVFLYNTTLTSEELVAVICNELELPVENCGRVKKLELLNDFLLAEANRGGTVVLLVDEAQHLTSQVLEDLRLISNLETTQQKLLQIVLVGQPELQTRLDDPQLRPLRQRVAIRYNLRPLRDQEIEAFINHRLRVAGRRTRLFTANAVRRIALCTNGIPRLINIVCNGALLVAYAQDARMVRGRMVDEVRADLLLKRRSSAGRPRWKAGWSAARQALTSSAAPLGHQPWWRWVAIGTVAAVLGLFTARAGLVPEPDLIVRYLTDVRHSLVGLLPASEGFAAVVRRQERQATPEPITDVSAAVAPRHRALVVEPDEAGGGEALSISVLTQRPREAASTAESQPRPAARVPEPKDETLLEILGVIRELNFPPLRR